ncbi:oligosaccharide flippase family protein [Amphritea balenae]|uniref:Uncharacterized protein n=1 Tax=Amphritea balenae TaxID=452629 RepID=A0A3P1SSR9_9GAMM|nr:oligosaccharide flippase family protein [Amphritea balenae]RRD00178.1 hypothetical protein EHS89_08205 [Amphritea balenae]GGK77290.1 polysaccharide biosynthesis related protein [Amphritea balenae]
MSLTIMMKLSGRRELLIQTIISFFCRALAAIAALITSLVIGRQLGAEGAGLYFLAFSIVSFVSAFSRLGLDNTIVRFCGAALPERNWGIIRTTVYKAILISSLVSFSLAIVLYYSADLLAESLFQKSELGAVLKLISPGIVGLSVLTLISMALQGTRRIPASILIQTIVVNLVLAIGLYIYSVSSPESAALAYSITTVLTVIFGCYLFFSNLERGSQVVSWQALFKSCMPLWIVVIMQQTVQWSGQFIAGSFVSTEEVAQLAVAQRTALLVSFVLMAVNMVVAPRYAAMFKQAKMAELEDMAITSTRIMIFLSIPVVTIMVVIPDYIMGLFGEGFSGGASLLQILAVSQFVNVMTGSVAYLLTMSGHEKELRNTALISGPVAIVLGLVLTPIYGVTGAAIATAIAISTQNIMAMWLVNKRLGFNTMAIWKKTNC